MHNTIHPIKPAFLGSPGYSAGWGIRGVKCPACARHANAAAAAPLKTAVNAVKGLLIIHWKTDFVGSNTLSSTLKD